MKNQKGFTLMELVVVIVIIGILAAVAVPKLMNLGGSAQEAACEQNRANIISAANVAYSQWVLAGNQGDFSIFTGGDALTSADVLASFPGGAIPTCPSGGTYTSVEDAAGINEIQCSSHP